MDKNISNESNYVYVNCVKVSFGVPALLKNSENYIEHDLHDEMIEALLQVRDDNRCNEYIGGHWDSVVCEYTSIEHMQKRVNADEQRIRSIVRKYHKNASRRKGQKYIP